MKYEKFGDSTEITFTQEEVELPFGWLGNMSPHPVEFAGLTWRTSEALFQALRFYDGTIRDEIWEQTSPMDAKLKAKSKKDQMDVEPRGEIDVQNMSYCLRLKVKQHPDLRQQLIDTGYAEIIEDVTSRGRRGSNLFWGALRLEDGSWEGRNKLGILWMDLRGALRAEDAEDDEE